MLKDVLEHSDLLLVTDLLVLGQLFLFKADFIGKSWEFN